MDGPSASADAVHVPPGRLRRNQRRHATLEQHFAELRDTWTASIEKWSKLARDNAQAGRLTPDVLRELFVPTQWSGSGASSFDGALRHVLEGPKYATLWNR
jgi:hypothetical protein